jgi:hypothetical protein
MNSLGHECGIIPGINTEEGFKALWQSQQKEFENLLQQKTTLLNKTNNSSFVTAAFERKTVEL